MSDSKLEAVYRQIPGAKCPAGCGACCGPVLPSLAEIRNIKTWCASRKVEYRDFVVDADAKCPYLDSEKRCQIYPVRPFLCRALGVIAPMLCPLNMCLPSRVLNHPCSDALYKAIYLHGKEKHRAEKHRRDIDALLKRLGLTNV